MKNLIKLIALCLIPLTAWADSPSVLRNEGQSVLTGTDLDTSARAVDRFGQAIPQNLSTFATWALNDTAETGSTASNILATAHAVKVGDSVYFGQTSTARAGTSYVTSIATNSFTIAPPLRAAPSNGDLFFIQRPIMPQVDTANGILRVAPSATSGANAYQTEDATHTSGDVGVLGLFVRQGTIAGAQQQSSSGDYSYGAIDDVGRLYINPYGTDTSVMFSSCSSAATGTADTAIKAAVASNRIYVTTITCSNNSTVPSQLTIKDGTTAMAVGNIMALAVGGSWTATFPIPIRGTVNTALNFAMTTTATSTTCCAQGYTNTL